MTPERMKEIEARHSFVAKHPYMIETDHEEIGELLARVKWLEGLFDFSDPEIVLRHAPNDPVTAGAVIVKQSYYEAARYSGASPVHSS